MPTLQNAAMKSLLLVLQKSRVSVEAMRAIFETTPADSKLRIAMMAELTHDYVIFDKYVNLPLKYSEDEKNEMAAIPVLMSHLTDSLVRTAKNNRNLAASAGVPEVWMVGENT
jgi:hypothetical protein